jgi:hypothetical protein
LYQRDGTTLPFTTVCTVVDTSRVPTRFLDDIKNVKAGIFDDAESHQADEDLVDKPINTDLGDD